jgi:hydrogenase maturation factor
MESYALGKLPVEVLEPLLRNAPTDHSVLVGPGIGLDAAVIDLDGTLLVAKTDPITFATDRIGWYAVHINANDIACCGAKPSWFLATLLLPEGKTDRKLAEQIFNQIADACSEIEVNLIGGHTEITHSLERPIVMGCMMGTTTKKNLVTSAGAKQGDSIILTGGIPIEATAIIAREKGDQLTRDFSSDFIDRCRGFLDTPGISILPAAQIVQELGPVHAMHDPTEGGLANGLWEMAHASGCVLEVDSQSIPVLGEGRVLCEAFDLDPLSSIASGALLISAPESKTQPLLAGFAAEGLLAVQIGVVARERGSRVVLQTGDTVSPLPRPDRDEIAKLYE